MAINFKERTIKYINKDFQQIKRDLLDFTQAHHSGVFQDFNESSPGMALLELTAYIGDVLSFYQDMQFEELKQETARQIPNVVSFAKRLGYRPSGKRAASVNETVVIEVPAVSSNGRQIPDNVYAPVLKAGAKFNGPNGVIFESLADVNFSASSPTQFTGSQFDSTTGLPTHFAIRMNVECVAGETVVDQFTLGGFQQFRTIELPQEDVIQILSVVDSDGNDWYEVDYLSQEVVFDSMVNNADDSDLVPYTLKLKAVPRRFITDRDPETNRTSLVFGSGDGVNFDDELIPDIASYALPIAGRQTFSSFTIDPQNFLKTQTLGLSPFNTTLTVTYRVGGGPQTNVPPGSIKSVNTAVLEFSSTVLDPATASDVEGSIECINVKKSEGGGSAESIEEIKANSSAFFAAQDRAVTREDYLARVFSMPARFGRIEKAFVRKNAINETALDIHVLSRDENGNLAQATSTLVQNLKRYLGKYRMLTDGVNILQTDIINLRIEFGVVISRKVNRDETLAKCLSVLVDDLDTSRMQIGQPIVLSELESLLQNVVGVISVYSLQIGGVHGSVDGHEYSTIMFDPQAWTQNGILYCPENAIFEVKFPMVDIRGATK